MLLYVLPTAALAACSVISGISVDMARGIEDHRYAVAGRQLGRGGARGGNNGNQGKGSDAGANTSPACLKSNEIQSASGRTGQEPGTKGIVAGQSPSKTDSDNFINFCQGKTITNGQQDRNGSCNGIPMGQIPAATNMISAIILNPQPGDQVPAKQTFQIQVQTSHLKAGVFVNPTTNYYTAPQALDANGDIIGHCHVTVQSIGSLRSQAPPDPTKFAFFKGIDDAGNGKGLLSATVQGGLPAGVYRVCTMIAAANHQPVNMPVAQRGAQDDCTKFEVTEGGGNGSPNGGAKGINGNDNPGEGAGKQAADGNAKGSVQKGSSNGNPRNGAQSDSKKEKGTQSNSSSGNGNNQNPKSGGENTTSKSKSAKVDNNASGNSSVNGGKAGKKSASLGGIEAPAVTGSGDSARPFSVAGDTFVTKGAAVQRACDIQNNKCSDAVNQGRLAGKPVSDCQSQIATCVAQLS